MPLLPLSQPHYLQMSTRIYESRPRFPFTRRKMPKACSSLVWLSSRSSCILSSGQRSLYYHKCHLQRLQSDQCVFIRMENNLKSGCSVMLNDILDNGLFQQLNSEFIPPSNRIYSSCQYSLAILFLVVSLTIMQHGVIAMNSWKNLNVMSKQMVRFSLIVRVVANLFSAYLILSMSCNRDG